jgi:hypothetical protein
VPSSRPKLLAIALASAVLGIWLLAAQGAAAATRMPAVSPTGPMPAGAPLFGVDEPDAWRHNPAHASPGEIAGLARNIGAPTAEFWVHWDTVEPAPPQGGLHSYDFSPYDRMYQADLAAGIQPLITVQSSPSWAWQPGLTNTWLPEQPPAPEHFADWRAFLARLTARYPKAIGIQVWNEPNLAPFWGLWDPLAPTDPIAYAKLLQQAYLAIKGANPSMWVIGGAVSGNQATLSGHISERAFLRRMLAAGAGQYMDGISVHPYPGSMDTTVFTKAIGQVRSAMIAASVKRPIWLTELGITTTGPGAVSEAQQAHLLVNLYKRIKQMPDVAAFYMHNLTEVTLDPASSEMGYGLVRGQGVGSPFPRKPAFLALKQAAAGAQAR